MASFIFICTSEKQGGGIGLTIPPLCFYNAHF